MSARERKRYLTTAIVFMLAFSLISVLLFRSMKAAAQTYVFRPIIGINETYEGADCTENAPLAFDANLTTAAVTYTNLPITVYSGRWSAFNQTADFIKAVGLYVSRSGELNGSNQWTIQYSLDGAGGSYNTLDSDSISGTNPSQSEVSIPLDNDFDVENDLAVQTTSQPGGSSDGKLNIFDIRVEADWNEVTGGSEPLRVVTTTLPNADVYAAYSELVGAVGGNTPYSWSIVSGSLPPEFNGSEVSYDYSIDYSPTPYTSPGTYNFTLRVSDNSTPTQTADQALQIYIGGLAIYPSSANLTALLSQPYGISFTPCDPFSPCGTAPYSWCLVSGSSIPGLSFSPALGNCLSPQTASSVTLSGTPTNAGTYAFTLRLTDSATPADSVDKQYLLTVSGGTSIIMPMLKKMVKGITYARSSGINQMQAQTLTAIEVIYSSYSWSATGLPLGLSLGEFGYNDYLNTSHARIVGQIPASARGGSYLFNATIQNPPAASNTLNNIPLTVLDRKTLIKKAPSSTIHLPANNILQFTVFAEGGAPSKSNDAMPNGLDGTSVPYYNYAWVVTPADANLPPLTTSFWPPDLLTPNPILSTPKQISIEFTSGGSPVTGTYDITFWAQDYLSRYYELGPPVVDHRPDPPDYHPMDADANDTYEFIPATVRIKVIAAGGRTLERETGGKTKLRQEQFR